MLNGVCRMTRSQQLGVIVLAALLVAYVLVRLFLR
jgi:hypothetical protein